MKLKKAQFFLSCLLMCIPLFLGACGTEDNPVTLDDIKQPDESGMSDMNTSTDINIDLKEPGWVYVPQTVSLEEQNIDYGNIQLIGNDFCYLSRIGDEASGTRNICRYSLTDQKLENIPIVWGDDAGNREIGAYAFDQDHSLYLIENSYSADYSQLNRFLHKFDLQGNSLFSQDITEQFGKDISISGMAVDGQGRVYIFTYNEGILLYAEDGSYQGTIAYNSSENTVVKDAGCDNKGELYICLGRTEGSDDCTLAKVDFTAKQISETGNNLSGIRGFSAGASQNGNPAHQCDFLIYDDLSVYTYNAATQEIKELFSWLDSDINGSSVQNFGFTEDDRLFVSYEDYENDDMGITLLTRTSTDQAAQKENLVLAAVNADSSLTALAVYFNKNNSQYHITLKNYDSMNDLYNAILTNEPIDVISLSGVNIPKMSAQGIFENLNPYIEQNNAFSRNDFVDGVLDTYTYGDILTGIPATFMLRTVIGDGTQTGGKTGMTLEELFVVADRHPEAIAFDEITKEELMQYLMMFNEETFIDWNTGECRFDSAEFIKILEFMKQFPDTLDDPHPDEESLPTKIQNGKVLFAIADIDALRDIQIYNEIFKENASCAGFPSTDGKKGNLLITDNAFAIASASEHKEGSWIFIENEIIHGNESCYDDSSNRMDTLFPTLKDTLDIMVNDKIAADSERPENRFPKVIYEDNWTFTYHAIQQEEVNAILDLLQTARPAFLTENDEIIKIIHEEAQAYYSGQKSADDVAKVIQNRVSLYVSENI